MKTREDILTVVSHDLKAPLRGVHALSKMLENEYAGKLDEAGIQQLQLLKTRVKQMFDMIEGILKYSKIGANDIPPEQIDTGLLIRETLLFITVPESIKVIIPDGLPVVTFVKIRLQQVFQNLLSNAIKYMDKKNGEIKIAFADEEISWRFSIFDNGPGIEEKFLESIFKLFQTIKPKDEMESSGIGLAIVKKIITDAGGKIWVESIPGQGSAFHFTVLKTPYLND